MPQAISVYFILPLTPAAVPVTKGSSWRLVNDAPILTIGSLIVLWIGSHASAEKWFTGRSTRSTHRRG